MWHEYDAPNPDVLRAWRNQKGERVHIVETSVEGTYVLLFYTRGYIELLAKDSLEKVVERAWRFGVFN